MKLTTSIKRAALVLSAVLGLASTGCSRDHIEAVNLANEGDKAVGVNVAVAVAVGVGLGVWQLPTDSTIVDAAPPEPPPATKPRVLYRSAAEPPSCETSSEGPVRQLLLPGLYIFATVPS